eukprot:4662950-Pyramimonas_sp.AAC.3
MLCSPFTGIFIHGGGDQGDANMRISMPASRDWASASNRNGKIFSAGVVPVRVKVVALGREVARVYVNAPDGVGVSAILCLGKIRMYYPLPIRRLELKVVDCRSFGESSAKA